MRSAWVASSQLGYCCTVRRGEMGFERTSSVAARP